MKIFPYEKYTIKTGLSMPVLQRILSAYICPGIQWDESRAGRKEFCGFLGENGFDIRTLAIGKGIYVIMKGELSERKDGIFIKVTARMPWGSCLCLLVFGIAGLISLITGILSGTLYSVLRGIMAIIVPIVFVGLWWNQEKIYKDILCKRIGNGAYIVEEKDV